MVTWTRQQLEQLHPDGSVSVQVNDEITLMTTEEWSAWIDTQVGTEKFEDVSPA
jgi:uncharacterized transporter YbjL